VGRGEWWRGLISLAALAAYARGESWPRGREVERAIDSCLINLKSRLAGEGSVTMIEGIAMLPFL
jgi:hypothetical protein